MREVRQLIEAAKKLKSLDHSFAIASVVRVEGSAYRRPGARMLVRTDGSTLGSISGGCLESEVAARAGDVLETGRSVLESFEMGEDDYIRGFGTGCGGDVDVLVEMEPIPGRLRLSDMLDLAYSSRGRSVLVTLIGNGMEEELRGRRLILLEDGSSHSDLPDDLLSPVRMLASETITVARPQILNIPHSSGKVDALFEVIDPPVRLVVFGDGPDVRPVVRLSAELGWSCEVVGQKDLADLRTLFPEADNHHFLMHPDAAASKIPIDGWTAVLVMTHNYLRDRGLLSQVLPTPARYVGALGPRARTARILDELKEKGVTFLPAQLERLFGPAGLDIGTDTPEEIALAIAAEIQTVFRDRPVGFLRDRQAPIHDPVHSPQ
jgi:xanthine/CO dehydrogenase XdhC/CoxF family maturation factor